MVQTVGSTLVVVIAELVAVALVCGALYGLLTSLVRGRAVVLSESWVQSFQGLSRRGRPALVTTFTLLALGLLVYNEWLVARGADVRAHPLGLIRSLPAQTWTTIGLAVVKLGVALVALLVGTRAIRRLLRWGEASISRREPFANTST